MTTALDSLTTRSRTTPTPMPRIEASGTRLLQTGARGEDVKAVQEALRARGHMIAADGIFGGETDRSIRAFQRSQGITVDGVVGPETRARLFNPSAPPTEVRRTGEARAPSVADRNQPTGVRAGDLARADEQRRRTAAGAPTLAPANATPEERYQHYSEIVRRNGGTIDPNKPTVLGLRGLSRSGAHDTGSTRAYDDTFVVLRDGKAYEFRGATHAGQLRSSLSPDVNRDGVGDVGMIRPGNYSASPNGAHNGAPSYHVTTPGGNDRVPGLRDTNGDGVFSQAERDASVRRGDTMGAILFHQGFSDRPKSIGCQTLAPNDYAEFMRRLGGSGASFNYTLVDAYRN